MIIHNSVQGPWGKPKGNSGSGGWRPSGSPQKNGSPDIEAVIEELKRRFNGDNFNKEHKGRFAFIGLFLLVLIWIVSGFYQLQAGEQGVVSRFGKFDHIATSGLRYHLPYPLENVDIVNSEAIRMETLSGEKVVALRGNTIAAADDEILMLTGDENIINLSFNVQWKIHDPKAYVFNIPNPEQTVRAVAESAMREVIGRTTINSILTEGKLNVQEETKKLTQDTLNNYQAGVDILNVNLLDASFPKAVVDSARDVQAARADQERARNEAEAYKNDIIPRARGQAERMKQEAEGYKQEVVARSQGEAARFNAIYTQYKQAEEVTRKRIYLETMEKIMANANKIVLDSKTGTVPYLPLNDLKTNDLKKNTDKKEAP